MLTIYIWIFFNWTGEMPLNSKLLIFYIFQIICGPLLEEFHCMHILDQNIIDTSINLWHETFDFKGAF